MRKIITMTSLAALIALPLIAGPADAASCHSRKTTGTLLGGVGGALLGNSISHGGAGAIVGGLGGAVVGHEIGKSGCRDRRTYYRHGRRDEAAYSQRGRSSYDEPAYSQRGRKVYYDENGHPVAPR